MNNFYPFVLKETLRLLSMQKQTADVTFLNKVEELYEKLIASAAPKSLSARVPVTIKNDTVKFASYTVNSESLAKLLKNCSFCLLIATTLGSNVDTLISRTQIEDMSDAVILDALASSLADLLCDMEEASEAKKLSENEYLTMRFSPGYGDVPLIASEGILEILNAKKRIGMGLTESSMLIPIKSVTAFIGISDRKEHRGLSCDSCSIADRCLYRKRGDFCGIRNK
ncbi:MAG: hypothetical protein GXZ13_00685 [Synergistaceae bacterium]|nr:hypothetical protein [Synergistaceae bacterium]